jgi:hypothetical protein
MVTLWAKTQQKAICTSKRQSEWSFVKYATPKMVRPLVLPQELCRLLFIMEKQCAFCEARNDRSNVFRQTSFLRGLQCRSYQTLTDVFMRLYFDSLDDTTDLDCFYHYGVGKRVAPCNRHWKFLLANLMLKMQSCLLLISEEEGLRLLLYNVRELNTEKKLLC